MLRQTTLASLLLTLAAAGCSSEDGKLQDSVSDPADVEAGAGGAGGPGNGMGGANAAPQGGGSDDGLPDVGPPDVSTPDDEAPADDNSMEDDASTGGAAGAQGNDDGGAAGAPGPGGAPPVVEYTADCETLVSDPSVNWDESALTTDQEIVECLYSSLGRPVGFGEGALGGYDPGGNSRLVVIKKGQATSVEQQLLEAISGDEHAWIVFDKHDFAAETELGMYRLGCAETAVLDHLGATREQCVDYPSWCSAQGISGETECLEQFFNVALNDGDLPIRNPVIGSNKTLDGRHSEAYFRFSGFAIGSDSSGEPVNTAQSVILTHLSFRGAGHTEDHELDPDMIRSTGASHDIWIHKNDFDLTGDSAFDVKVGAYDITMSFNRVMDVKRATLHGSSDSREINAQITTTMHHNAFITRDEHFDTFGNTGRRVPLIRRGTSHMWNNVFMNYRKDVISVRVGATLLWEDNALLIARMFQEKDSVEASLAELQTALTDDITDGNFRSGGTFLWFSDSSCQADESTKTPLTPSNGQVPDLAAEYSEQSREAMAALRMEAGQQLVDYVSATAGKHGAMPLMAPGAPSIEEVLTGARQSCQ